MAEIARAILSRLCISFMKLGRGKWEFYAINEKLSDDSIDEIIQRVTSEGWEYQREHHDLGSLGVDHLYIQRSYGQDAKIAIVWDSSKINEDFQTIFCCHESADMTYSETLPTLTSVFRNWISGNYRIIMQDIVLGNPEKIRIADSVLKETVVGVKLVYNVVTEAKNLKKIEIDVGRGDSSSLCNTNTDHPLSGGIIPYIHSKTGMHCDKIPLSEIKLSNVVTILTDSVILHQHFDLEKIVCILFDSVNI